MDDTLFCPICGDKFRNIHLKSRKLHQIDRFGNWDERTCNGMNHVIQLFSNTATRQVDFMVLSLNPKYSRYLEIDFVNEKSRIKCMKNGVPFNIDVPKLLIPDFPDLVALKERVELYIIFS